MSRVSRGFESHHDCQFSIASKIKKGRDLGFCNLGDIDMESRSSPDWNLCLDRILA